MKRKLIILLLFVLLFPIRINALTGNVVIECDNDQPKTGQTVKCYIRCKNVNGGVSSFHGIISLNGNISITKIEKDSIWEGAVDNGTIDLYTDTNKNGNFNIASFEIKSSTGGESKINLNDIKIGDANFNEFTFSNVIKTINSGNNSSGTIIDGDNPPQNVVTNPPTGFNYVWILYVLLIVTIIFAFVLYRQMVNNNE